MIFILILAAALWGIGVVMQVPVRLRFVMLGALWVAVVLAHLVLPDGNALRMATGEEAAPWLILGGVAALVLLYRRGLQWLRLRANTPDVPAPRAGTFTQTELNRYARHIVLREIGGKGQKRLKNAKVLVIGAGGLGSPALLYLAAAGVGTIGVIDDDEVDNSNLQRQVIHSDAAIGTPKVFSAQKTMEAQNPFVQVRPYQRRLTTEIASELFAEYDLVLDGTDNFTTRYMANEAAVQHGKPLISGALSQWEGQISVFDPSQGGPCYQCVFPQAPAPGLAPSCAEAGVIGPLPGVIGTMMAVEAIKLLTGAGAPLRGEMLIYDALWGETRKITLKKRDDCPVCGQNA
jgi:molybdopterin/thiamine biosynthesis adenylyltransferase